MSWYFRKYRMWQWNQICQFYTCADTTVQHIKDRPINITVKLTFYTISDVVQPCEGVWFNPVRVCGSTLWGCVVQPFEGVWFNPVKGVWLNPVRVGDLTLWGCVVQPCKGYVVQQREGVWFNPVQMWFDLLVVWPSSTHPVSVWGRQWWPRSHSHQAHRALWSTPEPDTCQLALCRQHNKPTEFSCNNSNINVLSTTYT